MNSDIPVFSAEAAIGSNSASKDPFWTTEVDELAREASLLQRALRDSAESLQIGTEVPGESLVAALTAFRGLFSQVSTAAVTALQSESGDSKVTLPNTIAELKNLIARLDAVRHESAQRRDSIRIAIASLEDVLKLEVRGGGEFNPLIECQNKAMAIKERIAALFDPVSNSEFVSVRDGKHPLCLLIRFVSEWNSLDLEESELLRQQVAHEFGNLLATAIMRQHILLRATAPITKGQSQSVAATLDGQSIEDDEHPTDLVEGRPPSSTTEQALEPVRPTASDPDNSRPIAAAQSTTPSIATVPAGRTPAIKVVSGLTTKSVDEIRRASILGKATKVPLEGLLRSASLHESSVAGAPGTPTTDQPQSRIQMPVAMPTSTDSLIHSEQTRDESVPPDAAKVEERDQTASSAPPIAAESMKSTTEPTIDLESVSPPPRVAPLRLLTGMSTESVVQLIRGGEDRARPLLVWALLRNGRFALAYQLSRCEEAHGDVESLPPSSIRALILARRVRGDYGSCEEDYQRSLQTCYSFLTAGSGSAETAIANACVLLATTLAPALLARGSGAASVLASIAFPECLGPLDPLRQAVLRFANLNFDLNPGLLGGSREHSKWLQRLADLGSAHQLLSLITGVRQHSSTWVAECQRPVSCRP